MDDCISGCSLCHIDRKLGELHVCGTQGSIPHRFNGTSCDSCLCDALRLHSPSFLALNCYESEGQCELFFNYSHSYNMKYQGERDVSLLSEFADEWSSPIRFVLCIGLRILRSETM